jgi:predicted transcriptional regulator
MLSMRDILKSVFPSYLSMMNLGEFTWDGMVESLAKKVAGKRVDAVMSRAVITAHEDDPLMECIDHMIKHNVKRLPVVDTAGKVVGMIYERDVFFAITKAMFEENGGGAYNES